MITNTIILIFSSVLLLLIILSYRFSNFVINPKTKDYDYTMQFILDKDEISYNYFDNLEKKELWIDSKFSYKLHAVFIDNNSKKTIILCHGITWSLFGSIKYIKIFYNLGYNVLLYDHRNHGKSGGKNTTLGYLEKNDLLTCVSWVINNIGTDSIIGVHGESMGAATALQHANIDDRISFVIADCPFSNLGKLLKYRLKIEYKLPSFPLYFITKIIIMLKTSANIDKVSPIDDLDTINTPILFIHGLDDDYIPHSMSIDMYNKKKDKKDILLVKGAKHAKSYKTEPSIYESKLKNFLDSIIK